LITLTPRKGANVVDVSGVNIAESLKPLWKFFLLLNEHGVQSIKINDLDMDIDWFTCDENFLTDKDSWFWRLFRSYANCVLAIAEVICTKSNENIQKYFELDWMSKNLTNSITEAPENSNRQFPILSLSLSEWKARISKLEITEFLNLYPDPDPVSQGTLEETLEEFGKENEDDGWNVEVPPDVVAQAQEVDESHDAEIQNFLFDNMDVVYFLKSKSSLTIRTWWKNTVTTQTKLHLSSRALNWTRLILLIRRSQKKWRFINPWASVT
jgi:hypothetical protein